ncbi:uncharacterized protein SCHCODRAFT_01038755 [Schizophyllum commune H4-8]|uniref:uncharacterized protein n=1 Tax=Schizophyllum commune (strain H4-8 / FGSC 9210) TaxID=578458 RepID=UPI0021602115|nr:uncharacterized protein SCHCODRAFT_01038755 [Schizophyllum commune H4-8]KAI5890024.1 hypothetical protein SCHCODRAFT_01038755 [Schizophyllum commune H4-8]
MTWRLDRGEDEEADEEALSLVVHRSTILRHASRGEPVVHWKDWGPEGARWLCMSKMAYSYITTTSGQRYVQKPSIMLNAPEQPIHILDFNPHTVRRVEAQLLAQAGEAAEDDRARIFTIDTPTATIGLPTKHEPVYLPEEAFRGGPPEVQYMERLFEDARALEPGLPFVRTTSKPWFAIDAVIMDDERVIGLSTDWTANTIGLQALYFG